MKTNTKTNSIFSFTTCICKFLFYIALLTPILFLGCNVDSDVGELGDVLSNQTNVHVAFAGGGWRAHTGHSAWIMSLLDNDSKDSLTTLDTVFTNVKTISSNSGGSWFSSMLMYSDKFVTDIQAPKAIKTWDKTGWIGLQKKHFDDATYTNTFGTKYHCSHHLGSDPGERNEAEYIKCIDDFYTGSVYYWKKVVDSLMFRDYPLGNKTLNDPKQSWAADKSLLMASSLLNNSVVLNKVGKHNHGYYQACLQNSTNPSNKPVLEGDQIFKTTTCSAGFPKDVAAVTFSSLPAGAGLTPLPFLRELDAPSSMYNLGYTQDYMSGKPPKKYASIQSPLNHGNVRVMTAAAASSAAAGFAASEYIIRTFDAAYTAEDEALSFKLVNSSVQFVETDTMLFDSLVSNKVVRLADGGPVDNSGVAQIVSFLQKNNQGDGFNIIAFDNVDTTSLYSPGGKGAKVGVDIASLFGAPDPYSGEFAGMTFKIAMPNLQIFVADSMNNTPVTWNPKKKNGQQIFYTRYNVRTIDNPAYGIAKDSTGVLHSFTMASDNAGIMPDKGDTDFQAYAEMIKYINESLNAKDAKGERKGLDCLKRAFGMLNTTE